MRRGGRIGDARRERSKPRYARDLRVGLSRLGNAPSENEAKRMIAQLDLARGARGDGSVDFEEFCLGLLHRRCDLFLAMRGAAWFLDVRRGKPFLGACRGNRGKETLLDARRGNKEGTPPRRAPRERRAERETIPRRA